MCCRVRSCSDRVRWASWRLEWEAVRRCSSSLVSPRIVSARLLTLARGNGCQCLPGNWRGSARLYSVGACTRARKSDTRGQHHDRQSPRAVLLATLLVDEPITPTLVAGLLAVCVGIWVATTQGMH